MRSAVTEVITFGSARTMTVTGWAASSMVTVPASVEASRARSCWPTCAAVVPAASAFCGSTRTWISGVALTRSLLRLARSVRSLIAARTLVVALSTFAPSAPLTMTLRLFEVKPALWATAMS